MSSGILLLPSINRQVPRAVTQNLSGIIAYASRYHIYFVDASCNPPLILDSKFIFGAHQGKILSLSFCKYEGVELLVSVGDDCNIKVWDLESKECSITAEIKECARVAEWIYGSSNMVVYPSDTKNILKWNVKTNSQVKIKTGSEINITTIVSNEKAPHLLAIGHNNGTITVLNIEQENVLHRLKVHSLEITSLSWSPVLPDTLLSASLDLTLRVWKIGEEKPIWTYYVPTTRQKCEDKKKQRILGICHPRNSNVIICSNLRGDIGEVTFLENETPRFSPYYLMSCDPSCKSAFAFFNFAVDEGKKDLLYCFDPYKITLWNVTDKRLVTQIVFMSGFVYGLTNSSVNPNLLAISNGDGILRVWNSTQAETTKMDMISVYVHYKTKIMTAAWHPTTESIIAYGTDEGRVGIIDIFKRRNIYCFETHHTAAVYSLSWGPCVKAHKTDSPNDAYYIYSCGGGIVHINKENDPKAAALNFDDLIERPSDLDSTLKSLSEVCWKSDYSCLCVGSFQGYIDIYSDKFTFLTRYNVQMKTVESLCWHPQSTYMSPGGSELKCWLACCGNDADIFVFDTSNIHEQGDNASQGMTKKLVGHKKRVVSLCWSQHKDGFLVSASKDGTALVWNVHTGTVIATYASHKDVVFAVQWSVFDQDVIYSGGQDSSVRIWKISEQSASPPPDKAPARRKMKKPIAAPKRKITEKNSGIENMNGVDIEENRNMKTEKSTVEISEVECVMDKDVPTLLKEESTSKQIPKIKSSNLTSRKNILFPYYSMSSKVESIEALDDCMKLTDILKERASLNLGSTQNCSSVKYLGHALNNEDTIKFGLFTDQLTAIKMIETQGDYHKSSRDHATTNLLGLMAGNVESVLREAAESGNLSCFLLAMAPSVSHRLWLEMCEKYAIQLIAEHQFHKASSYFLICGKIYEAINVLADKGCVIDALALAKARLPESDPLIAKLLLWTCKKFSNSKHRIGEAECYLALNEPLRAAKSLASETNPNFVRAAAYVCDKFGLDREADEYRFLCLERCLMQFDWSSFKLLMDQEPSMRIYSAMASVHEMFYLHIRQLKKQDGVIVKELFSIHDSEEEVKFWSGCTSCDSSQTFIEHVFHRLHPQELLHAEKSALQSMLDALEILSTKRKNLETSSDAHITIAICITKFILMTLLEDFDSAASIFLKIFEASYNIVFLPKIVCSLLFPMCLFWQSSTSRIICINIITEQAEANNLILPFQNICKTFTEKIRSYSKQPLRSLVTSKDLQSNLGFITEKITVILSTKKVEDHLLAYFASSILNDLMRCLEKKDLKLKCSDLYSQENTETENSPSNMASVTETMVENNLEDKYSNTDESINGTSNNCENVLTFSETKNDLHSDELQKLIELALKEAEEKSNSLIEQQSGAFPKTDHSSLQNSFSEGDQNEKVSDIVADNVGAIHCASEISSEAVVVHISTGGVDASENNNVEDQEGVYHEISKNIVPDEVIIPNTEDISIDVNEVLLKHTHAQCLKNIEMFYNVVSFIVQNVCLDEFALLYYLKERLKFFYLMRASEELSKFSKEKKTDFEICKVSKETDEILENGLKDSQNATSSPKVKIQSEENKTVLNLTDNVESNNHIINEQDNENSISLDISKTYPNGIQDFECASEKVIKCFSGHSIDNKQVEKQSGNVGNNGTSDFVEASHTDVNSQKMELETGICQEHNYAYQMNCNGNSGEKCHSSNMVCDKNVGDNFSAENGNVTNSSQSELGEISELICLLEKKNEKFHYPSPFDAIPKILEVLYNVVQKSPCNAVQEKLHEFIHEIISWAERFFVGEFNFVCQLCQKTL